mgnify:CR=1 FL=1
MTMTKLSTDQKNFSVGTVIVYETSYGTIYGLKVIDYVWVDVDGVESKFYAVLHGRVTDNKFVPSGSKAEDVTWTLDDQIVKHGYTHTWTPSPRFKEGDLLVSDNGKVFYFESDLKVWSLSDGNTYGSAYSSLVNREKALGKFQIFKTASGEPFSKVVKGERN